MADVTDSERFGKRVKHTRKSHYVGSLFGARKVGESYEVEPLPEEMREEPEYAGREGSHREMLNDLSRNSGLPTKPKYIRELTFDLYKKGLCPYCEAKLSSRVCSRFASAVASQAADHLEPCCPECGEWVGEFTDVEVVEEMDASVNLDEEPTLPPVPETTRKVRVEPCECLLDERLVFWQADVPENRDTAADRLRNLQRNTS